MRRRSDSQIWLILFMLIAYGVFRVESYVTQPRPYLWQHAVLDLAVVELLLFLSYLLKGWIDR